MVSKQQKAKKEWRAMAVEIPLGETTVEYGDNVLTVKGPKGEISKRLTFPNVYFKIEDGKLIIGTERFSQNEKKIIHTYRAHVKNLIKGVTEGFEYELAVVFAKFPMTVEFSGNKLTVKGLLGEKVPRVLEVPSDVKVEVKGKDIKVSGIDKEIVGQVAANIEQKCRITHLDRRVVQDGIFITKKPHRSYV